jgi:small conductance mechanosensitive channel
METNTTHAVVLEAVGEDTAEVLTQLQGYGSMFVNGLYLIVVGLVLVFLLHKFASKFIYGRIKNKRLVRVTFGFIYLLVIVVTALLAMEKIGVDVEVISKFVFLILLLGAVAVYFMVPFFPRLPFTLGNMVEISGVLGFVDSISHFHTTVRKLDGTIVFIPNPVVLSSKILNFHHTPTRRVELMLSVNNDSDLTETIALFIRLMQEDERVLEEPAPCVFVINVTASGVDLMAFCWVKNKDWFRTRSDLWLKLVDAFLKDERIAMSLPQQEVFVFQDEDSDHVTNPTKESCNE